MKHAFSPDHVRRQYAAALADLRDARGAILIAVLIFVGGVMAGLVNPSLGEEGIAVMKSLAGQLAGKSLLALIFALFIRNSMSAAISVVSGPLLGIIPAFGAAINGLVLGTTLALIAGMHEVTAILKLFPHGLLELPAMMAAWGVGIWQAAWFFRKQKNGTLHQRRLSAARILLLVIMPLLLAAATMEGISIHIALTKMK